MARLCFEVVPSWWYEIQMRQISTDWVRLMLGCPEDLSGEFMGIAW